MTDFTTQCETLDFPETLKSGAEILKSYNLPLTAVTVFDLLVSLLVAASAKAKKENLAYGHPLLRKFGRAFFELGGQDEFVGTRYMQAAHETARDVYGLDIAFLSTEWSGIGHWLN